MPGNSGTNSELNRIVKIISREAKPSHLNCWRSCPRARMARTMTDPALSGMAMKRMKLKAQLVRLSASGPIAI